MAAGTVGANAARMAPFFAATVRRNLNLNLNNVGRVPGNPGSGHPARSWGSPYRCKSRLLSLRRQIRPSDSTGQTRVRSRRPKVAREATAGRDALAP
jgi:hypothetical protein